LDASIFQTVENYLLIKSCNRVDLINRSICEPLPLILLQNQNLNSDENISQNETIESEQSISLIQITIENLFYSLDQTNIENVLNFWLSLTLFDANDVRFDLTKEPVIQLNVNSYNYKFN
jgi:hypothetical protein